MRIARGGKARVGTFELDHQAAGIARLQPQTAVSVVLWNCNFATDNMHDIGVVPDSGHREYSARTSMPLVAFPT